MPVERRGLTRWMVPEEILPRQCGSRTSTKGNLLEAGGTREGLSDYWAAGTLGHRSAAAIIYRSERERWRQISLRERCRQGNTPRKVLRTGRWQGRRS
jgi:hypothetical protein